MKKSNLFIIIIIIVGAIAVGTLFALRKPNNTIFVSECITESTIESGDTLSKLLTDQGVSWDEVNDISNTLKKEAGISGLRAGSDKILFERPSDDAPVSKIVLVQGPWKQVELSCDDARKWTANTIDVARDTRVIHRRGNIKDGDSFYNAGIRAGIPAAVLADVYDLLAFEIDFERDVRSGQNFHVLFEENYSQGIRIDTGRIIAVSFDSLRGNVKMYRFRDAKNTVGYYDENGNGAIKSLKRTPINNARITSKFNPNRKHPVLGYTRAHKGVDFRAGTGTPIPAAGGGRVVRRATDKGYGNFIRIRHNGSFETLYAHMSRFQKGVNVGTTVRQGQIIGYVGSTGYSTGPHLHYEIIKDGKHVNPMTIKLPAINNLTDTNKKVFLKYKETVDEIIERLSDNDNLFVQM